MAFRDDRDALRAKGEALEGEVSSLREELERAKHELAAHEAKDGHDEAELERLKKEVARLRGVAIPSGRSERSRAVLILAALLVAGAASVAALFSLAGEDRETHTSAALQLALPQELPVPEPPPAQSGLDAATFGAVVTESSGAAPPVGDGCVLDAELLPAGAVGRVRLICADVVYDSEESGGAEVSVHEAAAVEAAVAPGEQVYALRYRDTGTRTGARPQLTVDTELGEIRATRAPDVADPFTAVLRVERWSTARPGAPLATNAAQAPPPAVGAPSRCDLDGAWAGRVRTADGEGAGLRLAPSRTTSSTVVRNGRLVHETTSEGDPVLVSPIGGAGAAMVELACEAGRASVEAGGQRWDGRFGPDGATFLGRVTGGSAPAMFFLRRLGDREREALDANVRIVVERALGGR